MNILKTTATSPTAMLAVLSLFMLASVTCLDSPEFWNHASMSIKVSSSTTVNVDFYFGWDSAGEYVYFKTRRQYDGWMAIGTLLFEDIFMIVEDLIF